MKKFLLAATAMALLAGTAPVVRAQTPPAGSSAPGLPQAAPNFPKKATTPATTPGPVASSSAAEPVKKKHAKRVTLQQHFDMANTTHDGKLTLAQATAADWTYVTKHFDQMDTTKKGYVTLADVHAYGVAVRAARQQRKAATPASATGAVPPATGTGAAPTTTK